MKSIKLTFLTLSLMLFSSAAAQRIVFTYDAAGNRNGRQVIAERSQPLPRAAERTTSRGNVSVFPTVTTDAVTLAVGWDVNQQSAQFSVCDLMGSVITRQSIVNQQTAVSFSGLSQGLYFIVVEHDGTTETFKVIKQ